MSVITLLCAVMVGLFPKYLPAKKKKEGEEDETDIENYELKSGTECEQNAEMVNESDSMEKYPDESVNLKS